MSKANKTIQQKIDELGTLTAWFDSEEFVLEQALDQFKRAEKLAVEIETDLTSLQNDIRVVKQRFDVETA